MVTVKPKRVFTKQNHRKMFQKKKSKTKHFYENIFEKGAIPIINCPTRISENLASLTDN